MKKSVSKRFRLTRRGKLLSRPMGVNHFKMRNSTKVNRGKRSMRTVQHPTKSIINY